MDATHLLDYLWQGGQYAYYWTAPDKQSYWFPADKPDPVPNGNRNVYFGVNPVFAIPSTNARGKQQNKRYIRSQNDYIGSINAVFGEFDIKDFGTEQDIFDHLSNFPKPSTTIFSGGGYHLYWYLDKPFIISSEQDRERARQLQANWVDYTGSDKQSKDLARVLRVPGTKNYKPCYAPDFPTVKIIDALEKTYTLSFLEKLSEPPPRPDSVPLPLPTRPATNDDREWYSNHALRVASDMIRQASDGEKHGTLLKAARLLGGYVAGGIVGNDIAVQFLEQEISRKQNVQDFNGACKTIRDGLEYGKSLPITLEQKLSEREHYRQTVMVRQNSNGNGHIKIEDVRLYNAPALLDPEWMTVLVWGEIATNVLTDAKFCTVGLQDDFDIEMVQHFTNCHKVFVALGPERQEQAQQIAGMLAQAGIETRLCHLPVAPDEFFFLYDGNASEMFKFLMLGVKV